VEDLEAFHSGDRTVFRSLVTRHGPYVLNLARSFTCDEASAEDLFQDIWTKVWERRHQFAGDGAFSAWLAALARNLCISNFRSVRAQRKRLDKAQRLDDPVAMGMPTVSPAAEVERKETYAHLHHVLARLPRRQREAIELRLLRDLDSTKAAEIMDCEPATVRSLMRGGLQRLRVLMTEQEADA
jgi:RNA polymerase sigma-70 factor, ECF subfamily